MANKKSAIKELRKTKKRTSHNQKIKAHVKYLFKQSTELIKLGKLDEAKKATINFQQAVNKAAKTHVISLNRARRKTSSLMKALNSTKPAA